MCCADLGILETSRRTRRRDLISSAARGTRCARRSASTASSCLLAAKTTSGTSPTASAASTASGLGASLLSRRSSRHRAGCCLIRFRSGSAAQAFTKLWHFERPFLTSGRVRYAQFPRVIVVNSNISLTGDIPCSRRQRSIV